MADRLSNLGAAIIQKESSKGTAVIPDVTIPLQGESLVTDPHLAESKVITGHGFARHKNYYGQRSHMGDLTVLAEPNTAARIADMLLTKTSTSGSNPYTHVFAKSPTTNPNSYTVQIQRGDIPYRFFGVEARGLQLGFQDGVGQFTVPVSALGVFSVAEITNVNSTALTLASTYNTNPTAGLVATDTVRIYKQGGGVVDTTVSSLTPASNIVTVASASGVTAGDLITLRNITPSLTIVDPILWARSEYRFSGTDAATALTATHTPIEPDSGGWNMTHAILPEEGRGRSGSFDPHALPRGIADVELETQIAFDSPTDEQTFLLMKKRALVARHFCGSSYEIRVTLNNLRAITKPNSLSADEIILNDFTWRPEYDDSDAAFFGLTIVNAVSTI